MKEPVALSWARFDALSASVPRKKSRTRNLYVCVKDCVYIKKDERAVALS